MGHALPSRKDTGEAGRKNNNKKDRQAGMHTHGTEINMVAAASLKLPAVSNFLPEGTCQTPSVTGSKTVPLRSNAPIICNLTTGQS